MQPEAINILTIQFANEISQHEVPLFRGAINYSLDNHSILFHNHDGDGLRYAYPLIQYKQIKESFFFCRPSVIASETPKGGKRMLKYSFSIQVNDITVSNWERYVTAIDGRSSIWGSGELTVNE